MPGKLLLAALLLLSLTACSARRGEPFGKPLNIDTPELARGEKAYMYYCDKCHPGGDKGLGPALNNKPLPGFMIKTQVRAGAGAMPKFSKDLLPEDQLDDLVTYVKALRKS
jgi:mono/diheme cytochrome c family protein